MDLKQIIASKKTAILSRWFDVILDAYPAETSRFVRNQRDRFANPVGHSIQRGLEGLLEVLLDDRRSGEVVSFLDDILRIRAVQEPVPSQALAFIFELKGVIASCFEEELRADNGRLMRELSSLGKRIDEQALLGFDVYMNCREKIYELKAQEIRRNTFRLIQQAELAVDLGGEP